MGGSTTGYSLDKYDRLAGTLYNGMQTRSRIRGHDLKFTAREFQLWCKEQPDYLENCDKWFEDGRQAYSKLKPSCNRRNDSKPYSFDNMEMITWGEHLKYTSSSRLVGIGKNNGLIPVMVIDSSGMEVYEATSASDAVRWIKPEANARAVSNKVIKICKGLGPNKSLYGYTFKFL